MAAATSGSIPLSSTGLFGRSEARFARVPLSSKAKAAAVSLRWMTRRWVVASFQSTSTALRVVPSGA